MTDQAFIKVDKATYFKWAAQRADERLEFVRGRVMQQMTGGTRAHSRIADRIRSVLEARLDGHRWLVLRERGVDSPQSVRYADVVVEPARGDEWSTATSRPVLIVEVLSSTSGERDIFVKPIEYTEIETLEAYIVASQEEPACFLWVRDANRGFPAEPLTLRGAEMRIDIPALSLSIALDEIYRGIVQPDTPQTGD